MSEDKAIIDIVRDYISKCPYLKEFAELNVEYVADKTDTYSVNESAGYDPIIQPYMVGADYRFLFTFDSKLIWNEDIQNNIDNSKFFENFRKWLKNKNDKKEFPEVEGAFSIRATTNGYIFDTNANEAIYRVQCELDYYKED